MKCAKSAPPAALILSFVSRRRAGALYAPATCPHLPRITRPFITMLCPLSSVTTRTAGFQDPSPVRPRLATSLGSRAHSPDLARSPCRHLVHNGTSFIRLTYFLCFPPERKGGEAALLSVLFSDMWLMLNKDFWNETMIIYIDLVFTYYYFLRITFFRTSLCQTHC